MRSIRNRWTSCLHLGVLGLGLAATAYAWCVMDATQRALDQQRFHQRVAAVEQSLRYHLREYQQAARAATGLFAASAGVQRDEWRRFARVALGGRHYAALSCLAYVAQVPACQRAAFLSATRADGAPEFTLHPDHPQDPHLVITYLSPQDTDSPVLGLDLAGAPVVRAALERARDTGAAVISGPARLVRQDEQSCVLFCLPVYRSDTPLDSVAARRQALQGWVVEQCCLTTLVRTALGAHADLDLEIFDGPEPRPEHLLYDADVDGGRPREAEPGLLTRRTLTVGGRLWTLQAAARPGFAAPDTLSRPALTAAGGSAATLVVWGLTWWLSRGRSRALRRSAEALQRLDALAAEAQPLVLVARNLPQAVALLDAEGDVVWLNAAFTDCTGFTLADLQGRLPFPALQGPDTRPAALAQAIDHLRQGQPLQLALRCYTRAREPFWAELDLRPIAGGAGAATHFVLALTDATADRAGREERDWLASFAAAAPQPVVETDPDGRITYLNPAAQREWPDLPSAGLDHPILSDLPADLAAAEERGDTTFTRQRQYGETIWEQQAIYLPEPPRVRLYCTDVTRRARLESDLRRQDLRAEALLQIQRLPGADPHTFARAAMDAGIALTDSRIGYFAWLSPDESTLTMACWSQTAMDVCGIFDKPVEYQVSQTGLWGEAVRQRRAVITNHYAAPHPHKKGLPAGHVVITRHLNVPVFDEGRIVAVVGVGNKQRPYSEADAEQLALLAHGVWRILSWKQAAAGASRKPPLPLGEGGRVAAG